MDDERYEIEMSAAATKQFFDLERDTQLRIKKKVTPLAEDPRPRGCEKLTGFKNAFRIVVGDYRVVYEVDDQFRIVTITKVAHRSVVYRGL